MPKGKKLNKAMYYWFAWFAGSFITYQQIIDNIRPNYTGGNQTITYLLGIAPIFFLQSEFPPCF